MGLTQQQLADAIGVSDAMISRIEADKYDTETIASGTLFKMCQVLECHPVWLMTGQGEASWVSCTPAALELIAIMQNMSDEKLEALMAIARAMKS